MWKRTYEQINYSSWANACKTKYNWCIHILTTANIWINWNSFLINLYHEIFLVIIYIIFLKIGIKNNFKNFAMN